MKEKNLSNLDGKSLLPTALKIAIGVGALCGLARIAFSAHIDLTSLIVKE